MISAVASGARRSVARVLRAIGRAVEPPARCDVAPAALAQRAATLPSPRWRDVRAALAVTGLPRSLAGAAIAIARGRRVARPLTPGFAELVVEIAGKTAPGVWAYCGGRCDGPALWRHILRCVATAVAAAVLTALLCQLTAAWAPGAQLLVVTAAASMVQAMAERCVMTGS